MELIPSPRPATDSAVGWWTREKWTTDGNPPVCHVYYNVHGAIRPDSNNGLPPPQTIQHGMKLKIFSTIGDKYVESFTGIIKKMKSHPEYNDKGIDRCLPSMLRRVSRAGGEPDKVFQAAIDEAKEMYEAAGIDISRDDFTFVTNPDTPNYFQLYPNKEEVIRIKPKGRRELPQRVAAGDKLSSTLNDYGVWIFYTNVVLLKSLSLEMITDETLKAEPVNKDRYGRVVPPDNLFLPSELTNSINMVSRANNKPIGAVNWIRAIKDIGPMDEAGEIAKIRAITAIGNLWKTRVTTLHEILSIFAPFHLKGLDLGCEALKVTMLSTTCRGLRSEFHFPRDDRVLRERALWDSQEFDRGRSSPSPSPPPPQQSLLTRLFRFFTKPPPQLPDNIKDAVDEAMMDDESVDTSPQTQSPLEKRLKRPRSESPSKSPSKSRSASRSPSRSRPRAHSVPPSSRTKRGGAKRKNSNHTRRRLRLRLRPRH